jgi:hypothetical protein
MADSKTMDAGTRGLNGWVLFLIGAGSALVGLLPWILTGMRLPLQNLWAASTMPEAMPISFLPLSQYFTTQLIGLLVMGFAVGAVVARATRAHAGRSGWLFIGLGVVAVQLIAAIESFVVLTGGLRDDSYSSLYVAALVATVALAMLVGNAMFLLIAVAPRAGATIGISVAAIAASLWLGALVRPLISAADGSGLWLLDVLRWTPAVIVGIGLAWGGLNTFGRILAAPFALAILWIAPAAVTAVDNAAGSRVLAHEPVQMLEYGVGVFFAALTTPEIVVPPLVVAVVVALVGLVVRAVWRRARPVKAESAAEPEPVGQVSER